LSFLLEDNRVDPNLDYTYISVIGAENRLDLMKYIFLNNKINFKNEKIYLDFRDALMYASKGGYENMVKLLLDNVGYDDYIINKSLGDAIDNNHPKIVKLILREYPDVVVWAGVFEKATEKVKILDILLKNIELPYENPINELIVYAADKGFW